jgi:hypothetical protein
LLFQEADQACKLRIGKEAAVAIPHPKVIMIGGLPKMQVRYDDKMCHWHFISCVKIP